MPNSKNGSKEMRYKADFLVLGAGSWGTALSLVLARNGHQVLLWTREPEARAELATLRVNTRYLPNVSLPENIHIAQTLAEAVYAAEQIMIAVPSHAFGSILTQIRSYMSGKTGILSVTKGLDPVEGCFLHEIAENLLDKSQSYALLTGPSFATEVAVNQPTAVVIASRDLAFATSLQAYFQAKHFRVYLSTDMLGAELGGVVKNVLAIAVGIAQGLNFGSNTKAALITRGLAEMMRLALKLGARAETIMGLSGLGDLILTCSDLKSRNLRFGMAVGQGHNIDHTIATIGQVVEGMGTAKLLYEIALKHSIRMPIVQAVYQVLYEGKSPSLALESLLSAHTGLE